MDNRAPHYVALGAGSTTIVQVKSSSVLYKYVLNLLCNACNQRTKSQ